MAEEIQIPPTVQEDVVPDGPYDHVGIHMIRVTNADGSLIAESGGFQFAATGFLAVKPAVVVASSNPNVTHE